MQDLLKPRVPSCVHSLLTASFLWTCTRELHPWVQQEQEAAWRKTAAFPEEFMLAEVQPLDFYRRHNFLEATPNSMSDITPEQHHCKFQMPHVQDEGCIVSKELPCSLVFVQARLCFQEKLCREFVLEGLFVCLK